MQCPSCRHENSERRRFCAHAAQPFQSFAMSVGFPIIPVTSFVVDVEQHFPVSLHRQAHPLK